MIKKAAIVSLKAGQKYFWCSCGLSATQPFCDGAHKAVGGKSLPFQVEEDTVASLCQCKETKNPPYCDGTHSTL
jgi:CDGSH-type Zn-finger protein